MERVDRILRHPLFQRELSELEDLERERVFCRHDLTHLLDVARLMAIKAMEEGLALSREVIYAAALLHDIGRGEQYRTGVPHEEAGAKLARVILTDCGFSREEQTEIVCAIADHRGTASEQPLARLLYFADKKSRPCYACKAAGECNWPMEKRNLTLEV